MSKILQGLNETQAHDGAFLLTESRTYKLWESAGQKINEAQLTADQINQIFKQVEQGATAAGGNRTMLGKGKDAASAVNKAWEELKGKVQDSGPIKGVDAMYDSAAEKLKQATGGDQGVMQYVQKYRDFAKKHPVAQSLIYSALIAAAGISGAGAGGAAALGLFKLVDKLLQGEKFSSAAYQGAKTGAMAYGASKLADYVKGKPEGGASPGSATQDTSSDAGVTDAAGKRGNSGWDSMKGNTNADGSPMTLDQINQAKANLRAGNMSDMSDPQSYSTPAPAGGNQAAFDREWAAANADQDAAQSLAGNATATSGIQPKGGFGAQEKINQMMQAKADAAANSGITARPTGYQPLNNLDGSVRPDAGAANAALSGGDVASNVASAAPQGAGMNAEYLNKVINGEIPRPKISPEQAQAALDWQSQNGGQLASAAKDTAAGAAKGYSQEYLQKVANGEIPRPMITPEKAKQLLGQMNESVQLSESQIFLMIGKIVERQRKLDEGIMDTVKGAAGKAVDWAKTKGTNLTTKVTADKLLQAWKKAGSPTDSLDVAKIIQGAGVPSDSIKQVYSAMKIPFAGEKGANSATRNIDVDPSSKSASITPTSATTSTTNTTPTNTSSTGATTPTTATSTTTAGATKNLDTTYAQVRKLIDQLDNRGKQRVIQALKKTLGVTDEQLNELSNDTLGQYKTAAAADAKKADSEGDYERGNKRFSGIVKATKKQFANDEKKSKEDELDEAYNDYHANRTGFSKPKRDLGGEGEPEGMFMVIIDGRPWKEFTSNMAFARAKSVATKNPNRKVQVRWPTGELNTVTEELDENLHKWFKEKWVRFGPDGKIRGDCARGDDSEGKPKCLPQSKAQNLGKKGRASAAARKRREDPNPERSGKAINVNTKKKSNESIAEGLDYNKRQQLIRFLAKKMNWEVSYLELASDANLISWYKKVQANEDPMKDVSEAELDEACWKGYHKEGNKKMFGKTYPNCVKNTNEEQEHHSETCPHCGGEMVSEELMNEKKDACYYKVKSRYKVWPSAYASGALVKCRKSGADSWGNGGKKNESIEEDQLDEKWTKKYKDSINCSNPKGFSQKAHCAGKQKNESAIMKGLKL